MVIDAEQNDVNGTHSQTLCYLLGPARKNNEQEIWIDTMFVPEQTCTNTYVEDDGIAKQGTFEFLIECSLHCGRLSSFIVHFTSTPPTGAQGVYS